jgi:hypothetical protein
MRENGHSPFSSLAADLVKKVPVRRPSRKFGTKPEMNATIVSPRMPLSRTNGGISMSCNQISAPARRGEPFSQSTAVMRTSLALVLSLALAGCTSNPVGPSTMSTRPQAAEGPVASAQPSVTLLPPVPAVAPPIVPGQPPVAQPAPSPLPMPDVTPSQPGTTEKGQFSVPK